MVRPARWILGALGIATAFASAACGQLIGADDYSVAPSVESDGGMLFGISSGGFEFASETCAECVEANCSPEANACAAEPVCRAFVQCDGLCANDGECSGRCSTGVLGAAESYAVADFVSCRARSCTTACELTPAAAFSRGAVCDECLNRVCPDAMTERWEDRDAARLTACRFNCMYVVDPSRADDCACEEGLSAEALRKYEDAFNCNSSGCASACGSEDWSCLGHVVDPGPAPSIESIHLRLWLTNYLRPMERVSGVQANACAPQDVSCSIFVASDGPSDATGIIDIVLGPVLAGRRQFPAFVELSGDTLKTVIHGFVAPPLVRDTWRTALVFAEDEWAQLRSPFGQQDPLSADIGIAMYSCFTRPAPCVTFEVVGQDQAHVHYPGSSSGICTEPRSIPSVLITDVAPGGARVRAFLGEGESRRLVSDVAVPTKANVATLLALEPTHVE